MTELTLYSMPSSGNSYKARLMLAHLRRDYTHVALEEGSEAIAKVHLSGMLPLGKLPVLKTGDGTLIPESNAILWYLAEGSDWLPRDPILRARALGWMFWEQNQHEGVIAVRAAILAYESRRHLRAPERLQELLTNGHNVLQRMEDHLTTANWLAGTGPTVADIALYAYTHSAGERGGFEMARFPAINLWLDRVATLPGHVALFEIPE